jgi:sugar phosphate isomerase/epimerase
VRIGYHVVYDASFDDAIRYAAEHGFDYVQFGLNVPRFYLDDLNDAELDRIKDAARQHKVGISFHAPGDNISLYTDYARIRQGILDHFSMILTKARRLDAHHL